MSHQLGCSHYHVMLLSQQVSFALKLLKISFPFSATWSVRAAQLILIPRAVALIPVTSPELWKLGQAGSAERLRFKLLYGG